ncbi:VOC family protein [Frigidibacter sp. MR17.14]|uniref:VOC family protein n=1 Tax=Frigidibacter sp. MR17.14 TaxID=3126509 RepID=UPI003012A820
MTDEFRFDHVAISVPDINAAEAFYAGALGLAEKSRKTWAAGDARMDAILGLTNSAGKKLLLTDGRVDLEIWEFTAPLEAVEARARRVSEHGITHFGLQVRDIATTIKRLSSAGFTLHTEPTLGPTGNWATYGRDPFGNVIELVQPPAY